MIESMKELCVCEDCPSYNECASENGELLYCALASVRPVDLIAIKEGKILLVE